VILGLCSQTDLNAAVQSANERLAREGHTVPVVAELSDFDDGQN